MAKEEKSRQPPTLPSSPEEKPSASVTPTTASAGTEKLAGATAAADEEVESLPCLRVAMALLFLLVFSASFATITEFYAFARQSAGSDISGPFNCTLVAYNETNHTAACPPLNATQVCGIVKVSVSSADFSSGNISMGGDTAAGDNVTRHYFVHPLYQDFFDHAECSYAYCPEGAATKLGYGQQLKRWARRLDYGAAPPPQSSCWLDATKPDRAFLELEDFSHGKLFFSKAAAYIILIVPPMGIAASLVAAVVCLILGKLSAAEVKMRADALS